ncbi:ABC transporter permease [Planotetraspora sp. GP83]|uniref:ABC transporter permease n=1 Tax=Planotetraspora sp. GP83 TaxID=3156264 RepID=UPI003516CAB2
MSALIPLTAYYLRATFKNKFAVVFGAVQPLFFLLLFGPLFARSGVGSWDTLVPGLLVQLALMSSGLVGFGASVSYAAALTIRQELFAPLMTTLVIPLMLLSGALLPMSLAPAWLDAVSRFTPFRYAVEALRALFAGSYASSEVLWGVLVSAVFVVAGVVIGTRLFQRENA